MDFLKVAESSKTEDMQLSDKILGKVQAQVDSFNIHSTYG